MILDDQAKALAGTPLDLDAIRPGPGEPIVMVCVGQTPGALVTVTTAPDDGAGAPQAPIACTTATVGPDGSVQFELPSTTLQWIVSDVDAWVVLKGGQTNL